MIGNEKLSADEVNVKAEKIVLKPEAFIKIFDYFWDHKKECINILKTKTMKLFDMFFDLDHSKMKEATNFIDFLKKGNDNLVKIIDGGKESLWSKLRDFITFKNHHSVVQ